MAQPKRLTADQQRRDQDPRYRLLTQIAYHNRTPVSVEAERWSDDDLHAHLRSQEAEQERCPQCRLTPEAAHHVTAVIERCPTCEARDTKRHELSQQANRHGQYVNFYVIEDPELAVRASAHAQYTAEGARARKTHEAGGS